MKTMRVVVSVISICLVGQLTIASVDASPFVSVGEGQNVTWTQAIGNGSIQPAGSSPFAYPSPQALNFYNSQVIPGVVNYQNPVLTPDLFVSDGFENHQSLVMSWDLTDPDNLDVAAWDYVYDIDPDLNGHKIHFSLYPPPGIWDVSLELVDANGRWRSWFISGPLNAWGNYWIDPSITGGQGPFNVFLGDPLFDLSMVVGVRFDEAGMQSIVFPAPPAGAPALPGWNAWDNVHIGPEPSSFVLAAFGLIGFALFARRRRRKP